MLQPLDTQPDPEIPRLLKERREEQGLTVLQLCARIGINPSTLHRYQNGELTPPLDKAILLEVTLNIPANSWFYVLSPGEEE